MRSERCGANRRFYFSRLGVSSLVNLRFANVSDETHATERKEGNGELDFRQILIDGDFFIGNSAKKAQRNVVAKVVFFTFRVSELARS